MSAELLPWTTRLEQHFGELHSSRTTGSRGRVFALEHGLAPDEVKSLAQTVRASITAGHLLRHHPLPWIVYASELGYRYSGDEYWRTFESETPGWASYGDRQWIRESYRSFKQAFGGAEPTGLWAEHFSIICWPITHAILPRDLQRQLARSLYELRYAFSASLFESPVELGNLIAANSWNATSRFQNLVQEPELVGQIATALLLQGKKEAGTLIHPTTLSRIGRDLDQESRAREWLRGARLAASQRATVRGLVLGRSGSSDLARRPAEARDQVAELGIEPRLVLHPTENPNSWSLSLEVPDLSHLLTRFPASRETLTNSRCVVAGSVGRPLARGWLLHGSQRVVLSRWPRSDEVLLRFDRADAQLEYLLRTECLLRPGPTKLFRIATDGLAYELRSLRVRPGERYIVVTQATRPISNALIQAVHLDCKDVHAALIDVPKSLDANWQSALEQLGLGHAKSIEVWPAGLAAVTWDGEGHGEWLASERPCLAVSVDHAVDGILVSIGNDLPHQLELKPIVPGEPVFIELPQLPVGSHTVRFSAQGDATNPAVPIGDLNVTIRIREARPWLPGISSQSLFSLQVDPPKPKLEELWEGRVDFTLQGPASHKVKCNVTLFEDETRASFFPRPLPPILLPVTPDTWRTHFSRHFCLAPGAEAAYDSSRICEIEFDADELGMLQFRCERALTPLRWSIRKVSSGFVARLLNDSGSDLPPSVSYVPFETPFLDKSLNMLPEYRVPHAGGLYFAKLDSFCTAVIAPPTVSDLSDLVSSQTIPQRARSPQSVFEAVLRAELWDSGKLVRGSISAKRKRDVLHSLMRHILGLVGGEQWLRAELGSTTGLSQLQDLISRRPEERALGVILARDAGEMAKLKSEERVERFAELSVRYLGVPRELDLDGTRINGNAHHTSGSAGANSVGLAEFALRLASDAGGVRRWCGDHYKAFTSYIMDHPSVARASRFLVFAVDKQFNSDTGMNDIYAGWRWL